LDNYTEKYEFPKFDSDSKELEKGKERAEPKPATLARPHSEAGLLGLAEIVAHGPVQPATQPTHIPGPAKEHWSRRATTLSGSAVWLASTHAAHGVARPVASHRWLRLDAIFTARFTNA
jgi:hypothetical protein